MAKVLITGMTAAQASARSHQRNVSFSSRLASLLRDRGDTVLVWQFEDSSPFDVADAYDSILVGVAPVLSLSSNHAFSTLALIDCFRDDPRLSFFIDAPVPATVTASLTSIMKNPDQLSKDLFKKRSYFHSRSALERAAASLATEPWPTTLFPSLPWSDPQAVVQALPDPSTPLVGINLDRAVAPEFRPNRRDRLEIWATNDAKSRWTQRALVNMDYGVTSIKPTRFANDAQISNRLANVTGTLLSPHRNHETWWTPHLLQSLMVGTPVATEWRDSQIVSPSWAVLPGAMESFSADALSNLANYQLHSYIDLLPDRESAYHLLDKTLRIN